MPFAVEGDELPDAEQVGFFDAQAHLPGADGAAHESEEGLKRWGGFGGFHGVCSPDPAREAGTVSVADHWPGAPCVLCCGL